MSDNKLEDCQVIYKERWHKINPEDLFERELEKNQLCQSILEACQFWGMKTSLEFINSRYEFEVKNFLSFDPYLECDGWGRDVLPSISMLKGYLRAFKNKYIQPISLDGEGVVLLLKLRKSPKNKKFWDFLDKSFVYKVINKKIILFCPLPHPLENHPWRLTKGPLLFKLVEEFQGEACEIKSVLLPDYREISPFW